MNRSWIFLPAALILGVTGADVMTNPSRHQALPAPRLTGPVSLEEAIARRRSVRQFAATPLSLEQIAQLCWAGQGITEQHGELHAAPSAGALYPLELYVATARGLDRYDPKNHALQPHLPGDLRPALRRAALDQEAIATAPACIIITAVVERTANRYGQRAERYCFIEAGHVAQNILLQATALQLAGLPVGAFDDDAMAQTLKLPKGQRVLYLIPLGHPAAPH